MSDDPLNQTGVGHTDGRDEVHEDDIVQDLLNRAAQLATNQSSALVHF